MPEYESLGGGGSGTAFSWRAYTSLEKKLILLTVVFGIVIFSLALALATHTCAGPHPNPTKPTTVKPTTTKTTSQATTTTKTTSQATTTTKPTTTTKSTTQPPTTEITSAIKNDTTLAPTETALKNTNMPNSNSISN